MIIARKRDIFQEQKKQRQAKVESFYVLSYQVVIQEYSEL
jgi:hypothetical protein